MNRGLDAWEGAERSPTSCGPALHFIEQLLRRYWLPVTRPSEGDRHEKVLEEKNTKTKSYNSG